MTSISNNLVRSNLLQIDPGTLLLRKLSGSALQQFQDRVAKAEEVRGALDATQPPGKSLDSLMKATQARSEFQAQQIAQEGSGETDESSASAADAFLDYMAKSPEERYFEAFLKSKGMTPEEFAALPPEQQQAVMQEFEEYMKQSVEKDSAEKLARAGRSGLL